MRRPVSLEGNLQLLRQGIELLTRLPDPDYRQAAPGHSAVGAQFRHVLDHYRCLLDGLQAGEVDYDKRSRDPEVEQSREAAIRSTRELLDRLRLLSRSHLGLPLRVLQSSSDTEPDELQGSSLGRELLFLVSHTVHHYAIIKLLLDARGVACSADFGVAPSTLAYRRAAG